MLPQNSEVELNPQKAGSDSEPSRGRLQPCRWAERDFLRKGGATAWVSRWLFKRKVVANNSLQVYRVYRDTRMRKELQGWHPKGRCSRICDQIRIKQKSRHKTCSIHIEEANKYKKSSVHNSNPLWTLDMVGVTGFEPTTSWSRTKRTTKLCHTDS